MVRRVVFAIASFIAVYNANIIIFDDVEGYRVVESLEGQADTDVMERDIDLDMIEEMLM